VLELPSRKPLTLIPEAQAPDLAGTVVVRDTIPELVEEMGRDLLAHSLNCVRTFGDFHIALSAGHTPVPFYLHLMIDPICRAIPWRKTHLWMVNEEYDRRRPSNQSNWNAIAGFFAEHAGIPDRQQHPIMLQSPRPHQDYELEIRQTLEWREKGHDRLDFVLLGLDTDGSIAGLTPFSPLLTENNSLVASTNGSHQPEISTHPDQQHIHHSNQYITMTLPLLNASRFIAIMVTGKHKQRIIKKLIHRSQPDKHNNQSHSNLTHPVQRINPHAGALRWYLDKNACPDNS